MRLITKYQSLLVSIWILLLPFWDFGSGVFLGFAFLLGCLSIPSKRILWNYASLPWMFFGLAFFGGVWTLSFDMSYLYRLLPFALIPVATIGQWKSIRIALPLGAMSICSFLIITAGISFLGNGNWSVIFYRDFTQPLHQHIYLITYLCLAILSVFELNLKLFVKNTFILVCFIAIGLMGSKVGFLAIACVSLIIGFTHVRKRLSHSTKKSRIKYFAFIVLISLIFTLSQLFSSGRELGNVFKPISPNWATGSFDTRVIQNKAAIEVWSNHLWRGAGVVNVQNELIDEYQNINYRFGLKRGLNVHNQGLQYLSTYGLFGLIWIIVSCLIAYRTNFREASEWKVKKAFVWVVFFGFLFLTESYLERSLGISTWVLGWVWVLQDSEEMIS